MPKVHHKVAHRLSAQSTPGYMYIYMYIYTERETERERQSEREIGRDIDIDITCGQLPIPWHSSSLRKANPSLELKKCDQVIQVRSSLAAPCPAATGILCYRYMYIYRERENI